MSFYTVLAHWWNSLGVMDLINACSSKSTEITIDFTTEVETGRTDTVGQVYPKVL
jgi:hypothetical protein